MSNASVWSGVVKGSTLRFSVKGKKPTDINFVADARVVPTTGAEVLVPDHKLNPGPHELVTKEDTSYVVRLAVKFLGDKTQRAVISAELLDPAGQARPNLDGVTAYSFEVSGKSGQPIKRCSLVAQRFSQGLPQ